MSKPRKALIAEDEPSIVASLEFLLRDAGYEVLVARDGEEALRVLEASVPDVALVDVMMPKADGFEVCRRVRENPALAAVRIVMLTARGRDAEKARGIALGADAYVIKPFSTKDLMATIDSVMRRAA